jgi:CheY-like chemotaxis protein
MRTADDEKTVVISIEDTGIGIPAEFFSQLFQAFKKADAFTPGTGLGLHISRGLAERMGGSIEVTSVKGQGTTFTVRLPVDFLVKDVHSPDVGEQTRTESFEPVAYRPFTARTNSLFGQNRTATSKPGVLEMAKGTTDSEEQSSVTHSRTTSPNRNFSTGFTASPDPDVTSSPSREPARVLVVDDNEIGRRILLAILAKQMSPKVSVDVAINGLEAVERFRTFRPCVVLTDVSMPEMDGVTAATEMRKIEREEGRSAAKIYAITGLGTSDPRLKLDGMWGDAALDGWLIKGQDKLSKIRDVIRTAIIDTA